MVKRINIRPLNSAGFTLVELIVVIVLLGILSVVALGKFTDLSADAQSASIDGIGSNFTAGINSIHFKWIASGSPGAVQDFIPVTSTTGAGALSVNANGWPADMRGTSLTLNSANDCEDVWIAAFTSGPSVDNSAGAADFQSVYLGANSCRYVFQENTAFNIQFDSNSGEVIINN